MTQEQLSRHTGGGVLLPTLLAEADEQALRDLVLLAVDGVHGCDAAGISLVQAGDVSTAASTSSAARRVDAVQYLLGDGPCLTAIREARLVPVGDFAQDRRWPRVADQARVDGIRSSLSLPLFDGDAVVGGLNLYADRPDAFDDSSRRVAGAISRQSSITLRYLTALREERAARADAHRIAETLQRSLLPTIAELHGITCAARYVVGASAAQVGGDWYDAFALPGGAIGLAVGDVMGHDMVAAAAMGQLRSVLRSYAYEGSTPSVVLDRMDRLVQGFDMAQLATAIYARLVLDSAGGLLLFSNAGHLPPLAWLPDGSTKRLSGAPSRLIGAPMDGLEPRSEAAVSLPVGSTLLLFTDGLVEDRRLAADDGMAALTELVAGTVVGTHPEELAESITAAMLGPCQEDDVALLIVRIDEQS
jgi:serine phosphatase RsbU (regulator of sigma subunit)